eukprot:29209-Prorocentrum_minimum.AAC.1
MDALNQPRTELKEMALSAATSAASAAGRSFHPYLGQLVPAMQACMTANAAEQRAVRAHATECMGILINSEGGKEALAAHIPALMQVRSLVPTPSLTPS